MALSAGRVGVARDQVDRNGKILGGATMNGATMYQVTFTDTGEGFNYEADSDGILCFSLKTADSPTVTISNGKTPGFQETQLYDAAVGDTLITIPLEKKAQVDISNIGSGAINFAIFMAL